MRIVRLAAAVLVAVGVWVGPVEAVAPTWIGVGGPADWAPVPGYTLEVGPKAWRIDALNGGGVTTVSLTERTVVRVRRLPDCTPVVRFEAVPGRMYFIRFAADGSARVEDWTDQGMDSGPALGDPGPPVCPALPDTSIAPPSIPDTRGAPPAALLAGALAAVLGGLLALRRQRT